MKNILKYIGIGALSFILSSGQQNNEITKKQNNFKDFQEGDVIAHTSKSDQSKYIQKLTGSKYSHMGILVKNKGSLEVLEAVGPVKYTPLNEWIDRGVRDRYSVVRLNPELQNKSSQFVSKAESYLGKPYDLEFNPSNEKIYCSEIVQKSLESIGAGEGNWKDMNSIIKRTELSDRAKDMIESRWGEIPSKKNVVTPASIMNSKDFYEVYSNY